MNSLPNRLQSILKIIEDCSNKLESTAFLYSNAVLYQISKNEDILLNNEINIIISYDVNFDYKKFNQCITKNIVISKEIEISENIYHVLSNGFELKIKLIYQFDPTRMTQVKQISNFNIDALFYNLSTQELRHPPEISEDISFLINLNDSTLWTLEDIFGFAKKIGMLPKIQIEEQQNKKLQNISLATVQESNINLDEKIENILLSRYPGSAIKFLTEIFVDGAPWLFKTLIDYMITLDAPINDESTIETVFNENKFNLVNSYGDHFLLGKENFETYDEISNRLITTLKLFFDFPNLSILKPRINRMQTMAVGDLGRCCLGTNVGGSIEFFGCGENLEEEECLGLPILCTDGSSCLQNHAAFSHIEPNNWQILTITNREWCPDQVCPEADSVHCLQKTISSSSSNSSSSKSSSSSALSSSSSSKSSSSQSSSSSSQSSSSNSSSSSSSSSERSSSSSSSFTPSSSSSSLTLCDNCPNFNFDIGSVTNGTFTYSGKNGITSTYATAFANPHTLDASGCVIFKLNIPNITKTYEFSVGNNCASPIPNTTAFSEFDAVLEMFDETNGDCPNSPSFGPIPTISSCANLTAVATNTGTHYLKVTGPVGVGGKFVLAFRQQGGA